ncbi:30S ribosomal protein S14 [Platysternon megacephalum]|uniref:30S ribosomal protein S14 n=1 Tax=Platysternon megacephalum TaxID=55544 RepID=A0A4D9DJD6_9SAUR|nr:30S ribosomal protein S14 [Platysternon megacephalum]
MGSVTLAVAAGKGSLRARLQHRSEPLRTPAGRSELSGALSWQRGREETGERGSAADVCSWAKAGSSPGDRPGAEQTGPCCDPQGLGWRLGQGWVWVPFPTRLQQGAVGLEGKGSGEGGDAQNCLGVSNQQWTFSSAQPQQLAPCCCETSLALPVGGSSLGGLRVSLIPCSATPQGAWGGPTAPSWENVCREHRPCLELGRGAAGSLAWLWRAGAAWRTPI